MTIVALGSMHTACVVYILSRSKLLPVLLCDQLFLSYRLSVKQMNMSLKRHRYVEGQTYV